MSLSSYNPLRSWVCTGEEGALSGLLQSPCARRKLVGADSARLSVQGLRKHVSRINLLLASCGRKVVFAELPRGHFRDPVNVSSQNTLSVHLMRTFPSVLV